MVQKLGVWRDNYIAHHSSVRALDPEAFQSKNPLSLEEVSALLDRGLEIVNRYSYLFIATTHSTQMVGADDFPNLLKAVRADLESDDARFDEQIRAADERASEK